MDGEVRGGRVGQEEEEEEDRIGELWQGGGWRGRC